MACDITQADLGPTFALVDPDLATLWIETATEVILGPVGCQSETHLKWIRCCVDPCRAIVLLAQHLLASDPDSGGGSLEVTSERMGDVAITYGNATSSSNVWSTTSYGRALSMMLARYERCRATRRTMPIAVGGSQGCGC